MLRLFNDTIAMLLAYLSFLCFIKRKWSIGCFLYSIAVSIKMNILLFAPGLLLLLLQSHSILRTIYYLTICASVQVLVGLPFLYHYPISYLTKAFELGRVFNHKYTVNFKFLSEEIFIHPWFSKALLLLLILLIVLFCQKWIKGNLEYEKQLVAKENILVKDGKQNKEQIGGKNKHNIQNDKPSNNSSFLLLFQKIFREEEIAFYSSNNPKVKFCINKNQDTLSPYYMLSTLFVSNFLGIITARSLHYQFYIWYFHTLPLLLFLPLSLEYLDSLNGNGKNPLSFLSSLRKSKILTLFLMLGIEVSFSVTKDDFATPGTSIVLQLCHLLIFLRLCLTLNCFHFIRQEGNN